MANTKLSQLPAATALAATDLVPIAQDAGGGTYTSKKITASLVSNKYVIKFVFGDGVNVPTSPITTNSAQCPQSGKITKCTITALPSGSAIVDVWQCALANFPPTVANTITPSTKPTLSAQSIVTDTVLSGFTSTSVTAGDFFIANLVSASTSTRVSVQLEITVS